MLRFVPCRLFCTVLLTGLSIVVACSDDDSSATATANSTGADASSDAGTADGADSGSTDQDNTGSDTAAGPDPRLTITADWLGGSLSLLDADALAAGATTRDEVLVDTIDLSAYPPGPLQLELTPDGGTAVVSMSPGFFGGFVGNVLGVGEIPPGGGLVIVDIAQRDVIAELTPAHVPMGLAISPDGATAYTANYGTGDIVGTTMTVVDLATLSIVDDIEVGLRPEQVALSDDGALGIINLAGDHGIRVFSTRDPGGTLSPIVETGDDPSDVAFVEGTDYAVVANSTDPSAYMFVDVADPAAPVLIEEAEPLGGIPYGATPIPGTSDVLLTLSDFNNVRLARVSAAESPSSVVWDELIADTPAFPLGIAVDADGGVALSGAPGINTLLVIGLDGDGVRSIPWGDAHGPTYVVVQP